MKLIPINGTTSFAKIDDEDFEKVSRFRWKMVGDYVGRSPGGHSMYLHRFILGLSPDDPRDAEHKNRDKFDCQKINLRPATRSQNLANRPKSSGEFTSFFKGVCFCPMSRKKPWRAQISINGKNTHIGLFESQELAAIAYNSKAIAVFGEFAYINTIQTI